MVRVTDIKRITSDYCHISLFAEQQSDVVEGMHIIGLPDDYVLDWGTTCLTGDFHYGVLLSDGTWSWK